MTDTQISGNRNGDAQLRELEHWQPDEDDEANAVDLGLGSDAGWRPEDMFRSNEAKYGVQSTFKSNLEGYTLQLKDTNTAEYRERAAKAASIAREIEGDAGSSNRAELENGDEEAAFSAVSRPAAARDARDGRDDHKFQATAKRQNSKGDTRGSQQQTDRGNRFPGKLHKFPV